MNNKACGRMEEENTHRAFEHLKSKNPPRLSEEEIIKDEEEELLKRVHNNYTTYRIQLMRNLESYNHTEIIHNLADKHNGSIH